MPTPSRTVWFHSIGLRLVVALAVIQLVFLVAALWGLNAFLGRQFENAAEAQTAELGRFVRSALRQQMMGDPVSGVGQTLEDIGRETAIHRIWIIDKNGRVAHATDSNAVGNVLDKRRDQACVACHAGGGVRQERTWFTSDAKGIPVVRHVEAIPNEAACTACHDAAARLNGIVLIEESTTGFRRALATVRARLAGTGVVTLIALAGGALFVTSVLVARPVKRLLTGVRRLGAGDLAARVVVRGSGEVAELTSAFNAMAEDLGRSVDEVRIKSAELSVVYSILERVTKSIHLSELKDLLLEAFLDVLDGDEAALISRSPDGTGVETLIRCRAIKRVRRKTFPAAEAVTLPEGYDTQEIRRRLGTAPGDAVVSSDQRTITLPIGSHTAAALLIVRHPQRFSPTSTNLTTLRVVAHHASVAFDNARLYTLVATDALTRLFTVRLFHERLEEAVAASQREQAPFAVVLLDLDHFKRVNDTWGHPTGDRVLRAAAAALGASIRAADSAYRYGGEEFAVLLPGADRSIVCQVAERVRERISQVRVALDTGGEGAVTASVGFAVFPDDGPSASAIVAAADAALYRAKQEGRDRVCDARAPSP